jgi:hypothetical protein
MVQQTDATTLIRVVARRAERGHAARSDRSGNASFWLDLERDQVADVLTYIRNSWGIRQGPSMPAQSKSSARLWSSAAIDCTHAK